MARALPAEHEEAFWSGVANARRFFMGEADVQRALQRLARVFDEKGIPYAIIGAMALNEWGYRRVTVDVDVLLTHEGLRAPRAEVMGRGYAEKLPGSRGLRDTEAGRSRGPEDSPPNPSPRLTMVSTLPRRAWLLLW